MVILYIMAVTICLIVHITLTGESGEYFTSKSLVYDSYQIKNYTTTILIA